MRFFVRELQEVRSREKEKSRCREKTQRRGTSEAHKVRRSVFTSTMKDWTEVQESDGVGGNMTTTNRHDAKVSTTFSVFLLTGNLHPLILRVQIRGTWKRQADPVEVSEYSALHPRNRSWN